MFLRPYGRANGARSKRSEDLEKPKSVRSRSSTGHKGHSDGKRRSDSQRPLHLGVHHASQERSIKAASSTPVELPNHQTRDLVEDGSARAPPRTPSGARNNDDSNVQRSNPVPVPTRSRLHDRSSYPLADTWPKPRPQDSQASGGQDTRSVPSSVASVLASTSIPKYRKRMKAASLPRRMSSQQLMDHWSEHDWLTESSLSSSLNMQTLLSPPDHDSFLPTSLDSEDDPRTRLRGSPSAASVPSLTGDERSTSSASLSSATPEMYRRGLRTRAISTSHSIDGSQGHPLSLTPTFEVRLNDVEPACSDVVLKPARTTPAQRKPSAFSSNLTASLSALRSSIRSLSNFAAAPYAPPEDHLSRGLFADAQCIQREMRPRPMSGPPSPELRRYLNPVHHVSPHSDFHHHGSYFDHADHHFDDASAEESGDKSHLIALQDRRVTGSSPSVPAGPQNKGAMTEAGRAMQDAGQQPQREIRENSEWLRICVLETNMRRAGKLEGRGHARLWLPARKAIQTPEIMKIARSQGIPKRWSPLTPAELAIFADI